MSDIENKKVQDVLREWTARHGDVHDLGDMLGVDYQQSVIWLDQLYNIVNTVADRVDAQSVVEVQVPPQTVDPYAEVAKLYPMSAAEVRDVLDAYEACGRAAIPYHHTHEHTNVAFTMGDDGVRLFMLECDHVHLGISAPKFCPVCGRPVITS